MGRIYCIMGKSSSGKDTIYKKLVEDPKLSLKTDRSLYHASDACRREERRRVLFLQRGEAA